MRPFRPSAGRSADRRGAPPVPRPAPRAGATLRAASARTAEDPARAAGPERPGAAPESSRRRRRRARRRDRRVYLAGHPVLFALLAATRHRPVVRLGRTVVVHGTDAFRQALTRVPLDRTAPGTTGAAAKTALSRGTPGTPGGDAPAGVLFDQDGSGHRTARRAVGHDLGAAGVAALRPLWRQVLDRRLAPLAHPGGTVDLADVAREVAGTTVCALLRLDADPWAVTAAAAEAAAAAVREHLPGPRRPGPRVAAAAARLEALLGSAAAEDHALRAMLATAAVTTTVAALPRAAAWCADAGLWADAADPGLRPLLVGELLRVVAPSPLLPRVAAAGSTVAGCPVRPGDRLVLVARHAVRAHAMDPDCRRPACPADSQLVFGAGPHACPGARLARAQLADLLAALAPHRPGVVRARADRHAALPGWRTLVLRAGQAR